jgi:hypothetical protein
VQISSGLCADLLTQNETLVGEVCSTVDLAGEALVVTYETADGWTLTSAQLAAGLSLSDIPTNSAGNPVPGHFPFQSGTITAPEYSFSVPLSTFGLDALADTCEPVLAYLAAKAEVVNGSQAEGAYAGTLRIVNAPNGRRNWGTYFTLELSCEDAPVARVCETAFAYSPELATCFLDVPELGTSRWGWTSGPLAADGTYSFPLYAGAAQCDLEKGELVGTVTFDNGVVTFTANAGVVFEETHLYVGAAPFAQDDQGDPTVAPGQFPFTHDALEWVTSDTFGVSGLTGDVHLVAHAVACR